MESLDIYTLCNILSFLEGKDLVAASLVSTTWYSALKKDNILDDDWEIKCRRSGVINLFSPLYYQTYQDMYDDQVTLKSYTFMIASRFQLKMAVLNDTLYIKTREIYFGEIPGDYMYFSKSLVGMDIGDKYDLVDNLMDGSLVKDWREALPSILSSDRCFLKPHVENDDKRISYVQVLFAVTNHCHRYSNLAKEALTELLVFGEVRFLLGRSFNLINVTRQDPTMIDLDYGIQLHLVQARQIWLLGFLYYEFRPELDAFAAMKRLPPRFTEWAEEYTNQIDTSDIIASAFVLHYHYNDDWSSDSHEESRDKWLEIQNSIKEHARAM